MDYTQLLNELCDLVARENASDLHLGEGIVPTLRIAGYLNPLANKKPFTKQDMDGILRVLLSEEDLAIYAKQKGVDFSFRSPNGSRFRGNAFVQLDQAGVALRLIPQKAKTFAELMLPQELEQFAHREQGFFLVVGPTGHGKSTTLTAIIEIINQTRLEHIITIEDPIEFVYTPAKSIIDQREVGRDTPSFYEGLRGTFRQDVDVILVGEMREPETIGTAVTAAETGHMVFSTLHTNTAAQTIDRIIGSFEAREQNQVRQQLAGSLVGIFSQRLIPRVSGGLVPAYELLVNTPAVANLIRENRSHEINTMIETGSTNGMIDLNRTLAELARQGEITIENAYRFSTNVKMLERLV
ncbi:MAG: type IV pili twitching motility protein PilT [Candidatus Zambryskibacteria bacterium CG10_big_fil_rev_8_21_14_0_10_42_12]|uniref:Type IV pili twitching motility protein PilT n=1 Tax=Candidatus Zambryskibacteria bacterium CG10_big_fil_rev_8_21_14_0_10_42_12 TaxID=1975115 RepID=A0A2H0QX64_9BACT|nr:MAG: type IV pili twitching motility protein PilT [Candidatus Zambryskibacteria bacterium CG10_big_fil_rev_8_21_14_0_10_42_12]